MSQQQQQQQQQQEQASHARIATLAKHVKPAQEGQGDSNTVSPQSTMSASEVYHGLFSSPPHVLRHGGDLVADVLEAHGVKFLFTLAGGHISPLLVSSKNRGIRVIDVRHEVNAVFAADAVGRLTGRPGVAAVTAGPGVTNTITAVKNAVMAQSPLVLIGGAAATIMQGRGSLQDIDQQVLLRPIVKEVFMVRAVRDIVPMLRKAFQTAVSGVPGPVFVEMPIDTLYPVLETKAGMGLVDRSRKRDVVADTKLKKRLIVPVEHQHSSKDEYLATLGDSQPVFLEQEESKNPWLADKVVKFTLGRLWGAPFGHEAVGPLPVQIPLASKSEIAQVAKLIRGAKSPVLICGSGAMLNTPEIAQQLQAAVVTLGVPTFLGGMSRGLLGRNSPLHIRQGRREALKKADVVILAGAVADFRLDYGRAFSKKSKIVAVNRCTDMLALNADIFWSATFKSATDPAHFLIELAKSAPVGPQNAAWARQLKSGEVAKEEKNSQMAKQAALGHGSEAGTKLVNPLGLCEALEQVLPESMDRQSVLVADGGDFVATASYILRPRGPLSWLDPGAFGTLGVGAGFALGAKLVKPDADVWIVWGDGSAGYSIAEFDTFKRHNVPVIGLIGNDACWTQIEREQIPIFDSDVACPLEYRSYDQVATGYGGEGFTIAKADNQQELQQLLAKAQQAAREGVPQLVNVRIGSTSFREGSLSV